MQYQRRKDDAVCFNGEDYKRPVQNVTCSCTLEDFEWLVLASSCLFVPSFPFVYFLLLQDLFVFKNSLLCS